MPTATTITIIIITWHISHREGLVYQTPLGRNFYLGPVILNNWSCPQNVNVRINLYIRPKLLILLLFLLLPEQTPPTRWLMFAMDGSFCKCVLILDFTSQLYHPHSRPRPRLAYTTAPGLKFVIHFLRWHFILHTRHHHPAAAVPRPKYYVRHLFLFNALTATLCHTYRYDFPITAGLQDPTPYGVALHCHSYNQPDTGSVRRYVCMGVYQLQCDTVSRVIVLEMMGWLRI